MPTPNEAMTQTELFEAASIPTRETGRKALDELFSVGRNERTGKDISKDPFRYSLAGPPEPRRKTKSRIRHNQAIQAILRREAE
jgi:hypothetical protein